MFLNRFPKQQKYFYWNAFSQESAKQQSLGCAMAQAISRHPSIEKALVRSQAIPYGIIGNQSGTMAVLPEYFCFPHHYHNTDSP
jgi:hypothetical protein